MIYDIGKRKYNNLTFKEYERIESGYLEAIRLVMEENGIKLLTVKSLEKKHSIELLKEHNLLDYINDSEFDFEQEIQNLSNRNELRFDEVIWICKLILREIIWMELISEKVEVKFGYDYYMYLKCSNLSMKTIEEMKELGLYVESDFGR